MKFMEESLEWRAPWKMFCTRMMSRPFKIKCLYMRRDMRVTGKWRKEGCNFIRCFELLPKSTDEEDRINLSATQSSPWSTTPFRLFALNTNNSLFPFVRFLRRKEGERERKNTCNFSNLDNKRHPEGLQLSYGNSHGTQSYAQRNFLL